MTAFIFTVLIIAIGCGLHLDYVEPQLYDDALERRV